MKKISLIAFVIYFLTGCQSLQFAGTAEYSIKPFATEGGKLACCEVSVKNGKEIANLEASITKTGDDYSITLKENGIAAFKGQQVSADALKTMVEAAVKAAALPYGGAALGTGLQLIK